MGDVKTIDLKALRVLIKERVFKIEGGRVDDKDDLGGLTAKGGLTEGLAKKYKRLWSKHNFHGDMTNVPYALVMEISDLEFYDPLGIDFKSKKFPDLPTMAEMSPALAAAMYNWGYNSGSSRPIRALQLFLNVMNKKGTLYANIVPDGQFGSGTLKALHSFLAAFRYKDGERKVVQTILRQQYAFYIEISEERANEASETFTDGWISRVDENKEWIEHTDMLNRYLTDTCWYPLTKL